MTARCRHDRALRPIRTLIERGQADGSFRTDLESDWLVNVCYAVMHAAADRIETGQLASNAAAAVVYTTLSSLIRSD